MKKFSVILAVTLILALAMQISVFAVVLEVDTSSPEFKSDTWQNNEAGDEVYPITLAFETTPTAGVDVSEVQRFCACVQAGADNIVGELTFINGTAVNNAVFPFKETVKIDSITWKNNNGVRQYFFTFYTSMDGQNWTEAEIAENAKKVTVGTTYDDTGVVAGPSVVCWASTPAGVADNEDINPITFKLTQTAEAKYLKVAMYGNDGGSGDLEVSNAWFSFNSLKIEGEVVQAVAETPVVADNPEAEETPVLIVSSVLSPVTAPLTGDEQIYIMIFALMASAGVALYSKKRINK